MKIGIIGPGSIAETVTEGLLRTDGIECYAVASRSMERAEAFAAENKMIVAEGEEIELIREAD